MLFFKVKYIHLDLEVVQWLISSHYTLTKLSTVLMIYNVDGGRQGRHDEHDFVSLLVWSSKWGCEYYCQAMPTGRPIMPCEGNWVDGMSYPSKREVEPISISADTVHCRLTDHWNVNNSNSFNMYTSWYSRHSRSCSSQ